MKLSDDENAFDASIVLFNLIAFKWQPEKAFYNN